MTFEEFVRAVEIYVGYEEYKSEGKLSEHLYECTGFSEGMDCCLLRAVSLEFLWGLMRPRTLTELEVQAVHDTIVEDAYVKEFDEVVSTVLQVLGLRGPDEGTDKGASGEDDDVAADTRVGNKPDAVRAPGDDHDGPEEAAGGDTGAPGNTVFANRWGVDMSKLKIQRKLILTGTPRLSTGDRLLVDWEIVIE
jgi:hypothetical protein